MNQKTLILSLLLVLLIAGCTGSNSSQSNGKEILKIIEFDSFPKETVRPGETLILRATIKNVADVSATFDIGQNGKNILFDYCSGLYILENNTEVSQFDDYSGFEILTGNVRVYYDSEGNLIDEPTEYSKMTLDPNDESIFQWTFKAPKKEDIGADMGLSHTCTFKTQIDYLSEAKTTSYVYFAGKNEIMQRTYTGNELKLKGDSITTSGPVIANIIPSMDQPIPASGTWTFYLQLQNRGDGIVDVTDLSIGEFKDRNFIDLRDKCSITTEELKIYGQKSSRIACTTDTPDVTMLTPKRYETHITYTYKTRKDLKIKTEAVKY